MAPSHAYCTWKHGRPEIPQRLGFEKEKKGKCPYKGCISFSEELAFGRELLLPLTLLAILFGVHLLLQQVGIYSPQGVEVFSEIASAIDNREVLCFVCHFDSDYQRQKDDKYSIVKIYTAKELAEINPAIMRIVVSNPVEEHVPTTPTITEKPTSTIEQVDLTARSIFTDQLATEGQFFNPTIKIILDSIGRKSDNADKSASSNIAAKRSLTSETPPSAEKKTTIEAVPSIDEKNGPEDKKPASSKSAHMSPLKKQRESAK